MHQSINVKRFRKRKWLAIVCLAIMGISLFYACKELEDQPNSNGRYSQAQLLKRAQNHYQDMYDKYNFRKPNSLYFRYIKPNWSRNQMVTEGLYKHEYLKVELCKNRRYNIEMFYNVVDNAPFAFFRVWTHKTQTYALFDTEGKLLEHGTYTTKPASYTRLYPNKTSSNNAASRKGEVNAFCWQVAGGYYECIVWSISSNSKSSGSGYIREGEYDPRDDPDPYQDQQPPADPDPYDENPNDKPTYEVSFTPPPPPPPPAPGPFPEPQECDSPSEHNRLDNIENMPPENTDDRQINENTCTLKTLEWAARYLGSDLTEVEILQRLDALSKFKVIKDGFNEEELQKVLKDFTNHENIKQEDVSNALLNNDHPVMANFLSEYIIKKDDKETKEISYHEVLITGVSDDGKYFRYFDPQLGKYQCLKKTELSNFREIKGIK